MGREARVSNKTIIAAMVALAAIGLGGILWVSDQQGMERLGLLFALLGTCIASLTAALRSDQAAGRLNGTLDKRIHDAVLKANSTRRASDAD